MLESAVRPQPSLTPEFEFSFRHGGAVLACFSGSSTQFVIGSDPSCDIVLDMEGVAPRHALLSLRDAAYITDLDSGIGTYVEGEEIAGERALQVAQSVTFGWADGEFRLEERVTPSEQEGTPSESEPVAARKMNFESAVEARPDEVMAGSDTLGANGRSTEAKPVFWTEPQTPTDEHWPEAILRGAVEPRGSELFSAPPLPGGEVSITWDSKESEPEDAPPAAGLPRVAVPPEQREEVSCAPQTLAEPADADDSKNPAPPDLEAEVARLQAELVANKAVNSSTTVSSPPPPVAQSDSSLLARTNRFLFNKLAAAGDARKEVAALTKDLKQRELALVEAWSRRQVAEERYLELKRLVGQGGATPSGHRRALISGNALCLLGTILAIVAGLVVLQFRAVIQRARDAENIVLLLKSAGPEFHAHAEAALAAGRFEDALGEVKRALALEPENAAYYLTQGHIQESLLRISAAQAAYEQVIELDPSLKEAQENLELCRRISATRGGVRKLENLYGLHRLMLKQHRLGEALRMARRIQGDDLVVHRTWEAILEANGIRGDLRLNPDGTLDLDLFVGTSVDLSPLHEMPLRSLNAARVQISDLTALAGMPLRSLDLSGTMVRDLSALRGVPLETLDLSNTSVTNIAALRGMPLRELRLDYTGVRDISDLAGMPLSTLSLLSTRVQSIADLAGMPLHHLNLGRTGVRELAALQHAPLEDLNLESTGVTDLTPLAGARLVSLNLTGTRVTSLQPLRGTPLRELRLVGCHELEMLDPLATCLELERLVLPRRGMNIAPLRDLPRLRFLSFQSEAGVDEQVALEVPSS